MHPSQRDESVIGQQPEERALFEEMIGHGLGDVGRSFAPESDRLFTWWPYWRNARARNLGWRLDYIFASTPLAKCATSCVVQADYGTSDHAPVIARFADAG